VPPASSREPISESGWYRLTRDGWARVDDADAEIEAVSGGGWDLVRVDIARQPALW